MKNFEVDKILITGEAPVLQSDLGIQPNQIPLNKDLGSLAYMDAPQLEDVNVDTLKLREMAAEISDDIVDVFIYDTNNDSDGGKWRERTSHASWYNEELNTATRGSRREFPAVAVIVAESGNLKKLKIYDGDDPDLPLWMSFEASGLGSALGRSLSGILGISSVYMLNGLLCVTGLGSSNNIETLCQISFIDDVFWQYHTYGVGDAGISERNKVHSVTDGYRGRVDYPMENSPSYHDVAMTVLPNAPIDSETGLPIPTIAVATDRGVSVIKDNGSVVDITSSQGSAYNYSRFVSFDNNNKLLFGMDSSTRNTSRRVHWHDIPNSDKTIDVNGITSELYTTNTTNSDVPDAVGEDQAFALNGAVAGSLGLTKVERDDNRFAFITSSYNTGWMPGDIKLATLSDTKAEVIGGLGEELITNGTFDTDVSGWTLIDPTANPDATITWNNGVAEIFRPNGQGARFYQAFNTIIGREYAVSAGVNVGGYYIADSIDSSSWNILANDGNVISDTSVHRFFATSNVAYFVLNSTAVNASHPFDNISAKQTGELVKNGVFNVLDSDGWNLTRASVVNRALQNTTSDTSTAYADQIIQVTQGEQYTLSFDILQNFTNAQNGVYIRSEDDQTNYFSELKSNAETGTFTYTFNAPASSLLIRLYKGNTAGTIIYDNISIQDSAGNEFISNGTFDASGWIDNSDSDPAVGSSVVGGELVLTGTTGASARIYQELDTVVGKTYTISYEVVSLTASVVNFKVGSTSVASTEYFNHDVDSDGVGVYSRTFVATTAKAYPNLYVSDGSVTLDNISIRLAEDDRSINDNGLQVFGEITKSPVAPGADLVAYSGFSTGNYLMQPYNPDLDFGTGDFCMMAWIKDFTVNDDFQRIFSRGIDGDTGVEWDLYFSTAVPGVRFRYFIDGSNMGDTILASVTDMNVDSWNQIVFSRKDGLVQLHINGSKAYSAVFQFGPVDLTNTNARLYIGNRFTPADYAVFNGSIALAKISTTAPTDDQIAKIYRDEKVLFQDGAQATLYGTSDSVTALAYDDKTELLHVGTASGRSDFNGLRRVNNTTTAVTAAISANNKLIAEQ